MSKFAALTASEIVTLDTFARERGRYWKADMRRAAWETTDDREDCIHYTAINACFARGKNWLKEHTLATPEIVDAARASLVSFDRVPAPIAEGTDRDATCTSHGTPYDRCEESHPAAPASSTTGPVVGAQIERKAAKRARNHALMLAGIARAKGCAA